MQAFKDAPIWVKILIVGVLSILGVAGGYKVFEPYLNQEPSGSVTESPKPVEPELQNINFTVQEKFAPNLVPNVDVQIISDGPPTLKKTDSNGYLEIEIPTRKTVTIILKKEGYKPETYLVNLQTDPKTTRTFYIEPEDSKKPLGSPPPNSTPSKTFSMLPQDRIEWGNFRDYFEVEGVSFEPNGRSSERLNFIVTAKRDFPSISFTAQPYDSERIKTRIKKLGFIPNEKSWSTGERARVWVDLPYEFSKVEIIN